MRRATGWISIAVVLGGCGSKTPEPDPTSQAARGANPVRAAKSVDSTKPEAATKPEATPKPADAAKPSEAAALNTDVCKTRKGPIGPFRLDEAQAKARYGANAKTYADAPTTKERAIEVCGVLASRAWLQRMTCADGSVAKPNGQRGSVGTGGRCGGVIDRYPLTCPEGDFDLFIDVYMCGPGELFKSASGVVLYE